VKPELKPEFMWPCFLIASFEINTATQRIM
jgi:hypothetical protein